MKKKIKGDDTESKKVTKISLSTFFFIIAIIIIICMGCYIYIVQINYTDNIKTLQDNNNNMQNTINILQEKINYLSTSTNSNNSKESTNITNPTSTTKKETPNENNKKVDSIAKKLFKEGSQKIRETEYSDYYEYTLDNPSKTINGKSYQKANISYSDIKNKYSKIFTGKALDKVLSKRFIQVNSNLYILIGGATGWDITNIKLSRLSESNDKITYKVTYSNVQDDDTVSSKKESCNMTIKLVNGSYRISETNYYNI